MSVSAPDLTAMQTSKCTCDNNVAHFQQISYTYDTVSHVTTIYVNKHRGTEVTSLVANYFSETGNTCPSQVSNGDPVSIEDHRVA